MATSPEALAVQQFLSALFKATSNGYLAVIQVPVTSTGREGHESDWQNMRTAYYAVRDGQAPDLGELDWTQEWYLVPALLSKQGRQKDAILESGCLWVDFDTEVNPYDLAPQPSVVVQTSEGRFHCYWLLDNPVTLVNLEYHNRRLAYSFGSDHSGWDGNQLLRLPAGVNAKHTPPWIVKMVHLDADRRYSLDDFAKLPDHPQLLLDVDVDATAIPQSDVPREYVFNQLREKMTVKLLTMLERKQPDRSSALWWMYHECYRLGFSREEAFLLIKGTPNDKFAEQRYNGEQSLWRDILSGYNQSEAGQKDRGIIDMMQATRQEKGTNADKVHKLGKLLTDDMAKHGLFMQTENPVEYYYLDQEETCLHQVDKTAPPFRKLLLDRYAINAGGAEYLQLFEHVMSRCQDDTPVKVYRTAHYDIANNAVYVNRFDNHMYRLDGKDVTLLQNGHDGIFFVNPPGALPWKYETPKTTRPWEELVFSCANLVTEGLQPRQIHHIIRTWVLSQFFRELMPVKPILFLHGEAGSGKTSVFKGIAQVLQGKHMGAHDLPQEDEEFNLQVAVNDLLFYDNVDSWKPWLPDKLAMTSTSYTFTRRKLYTDNIVMTYTVSCFIGLTARTPRFMRDDVAERVIPSVSSHSLRSWSTNGRSPSGSRTGVGSCGVSCSRTSTPSCGGSVTTASPGSRGTSARQTSLPS